MHRVMGSVLGAILVTGTLAAVVGLPTVASAASQRTSTVTTETSSITLANVTTPVTYGAESQVFKGTVTGITGDGYPEGTVTVLASPTGSTTTTPLCTGSLAVGKTDIATFTCDQTTGAKLTASASAYTVVAHYSGGASSTTKYSYGASESNPLVLTVAPATKTPTVSLSAITSTVSYGAESQTFTGTVTGISGDGYPANGAVTVVTSTGKKLCTGSFTSASGIVSSFTCDQTTPTKLSLGQYLVHAHYTGGVSSNADYEYRAATSTRQTLTVVTRTLVTPTVTLSAITSTVSVGAESQIFTGTIAGVTGDGYPTTGALQVVTSTGVVLCTGLFTSFSGVVTSFSCDQTTPRKLSPGRYVVHAHYTGGASSSSAYQYRAATSTTQTLTVTTGLTTTTTTLALNHPNRTQGAETSEVFTVTVTGKAGYGYPKGAVTVKTSTGASVCSTAVVRSETADSSTFACSPRASALGPGTYELTAAYVPAATGSSSVAGVTYAGSTSVAETFTVVTGVGTTSTLRLSSPSVRSGAEESEVFSVTVTGKAGDGVPEGTVRVKTKSGVVLCATSRGSAPTADSQTYACSPRASALGPGAYALVATYTPATPSSSVSSIAYLASISNAASFTVSAPAAPRIYGATPDATAAAELESVFPGTQGHCPGSTAGRPVVLATDQHYPDALAASYLERWLGTGMLLTPTASLSGATLAALRVEGITEVYVVGGPLAVSNAVVSVLQHQYVYECGGVTRTASHLTVFRIYGQTQYTTAEDIARTPGPEYPRSLDLHGAYGHYNDTSGRSSAPPPPGARRTAILASGAEFQDAEASAALANADGIPLLLTTPTALSPQALSAITDLGITQVILMGGPLAVSTAVVTALVSVHVSVLRVAGTNYTDTAVQLADLELGSATGYQGLGWKPTSGVTVARGDFYTDGLAGAVVAAHGGAAGGGPEPMLLTENPTSAGSDLTSFLVQAGHEGIDGDGTRVTSLTILGGPLALSTAVVASMVADL